MTIKTAKVRDQKENEEQIFILGKIKLVKTNKTQY